MGREQTKSNGQITNCGRHTFTDSGYPRSHSISSQAIQNFTMLAQYVLDDEKTLHYIEHILYRLEKTKIAFEQHQPIDSKLCGPNFNYFKFNPISNFVQYIWDYGSTINYNTVYNKVAYKYFLKALYNRTNKNEYDSQIWQYNVRHTNLITIKDVIILE